jgi:hypothetical protein
LAFLLVLMGMVPIRLLFLTSLVVSILITCAAHRILSDFINLTILFLLIRISNSSFNEMHYFSDLFDKVLYMFRTGPLSIIRRISALYTRNRHLSC